jgi:hypothetical protein
MLTGRPTAHGLQIKIAADLVLELATELFKNRKADCDCDCVDSLLIKIKGLLKIQKP